MMLTKELSKLSALRPSFIEPMYARAVSELPEGNLWSYEAKLDGFYAFDNLPRPHTSVTAGK